MTLYCYVYCFELTQVSGVMKQHVEQKAAKLAEEVQDGCKVQAAKSILLIQLPKLNVNNYSISMQSI